MSLNMSSCRKTLSLSTWALLGTSLLLQPGCVHAMERRQITFDGIREQARERAAAPYTAPAADLPVEFREMDYDSYRKIRFRPDQALWAAENLPFQVQLFHRGYLFDHPVFLSEFTESHVQELPYVQDFFNFENLEIDRYPRRNSGYAGWRLHAPINSPDYYDEVIAFLGASYFRALGRFQNYGISARGLVLPSEDPHAEEFPAFTQFWLRKPQPGDTRQIVLALLDSPSLTGAYRFVITPDSTTEVEITATLYPRVKLDAVGLGALTSMFYFGENSYPKPDDFRPEVHDSDGLALEFGNQDFRWRPLNAGPVERLSRFDASGLTAFGLYQRDRRYAAYLDGESHYHKRPSVRVVLGQGFSGGTILLREIPPHKEFADNIVAAYVPAQALLPGRSYPFTFSMHWGDFSPPANLATVRLTRHGQDIQSPQMEVFLVEFALPAGLNPRDLEAVTTVSPNARLDRVMLDPDPDGTTLRVRLHVLPTADGPVNLSLGLTDSGKTVSEKWLYRWSPYN